MNKKRSRSLNWDDEEKQLFRSVLKKYAQIIENKSLDTNSNKIKTKAWEEVHKKFNELNRRNRQLNQLKIQWKIMKVKARKANASFKKEITKTGGGQRPTITSLNLTELLRDHNEYDSDGILSKPINYVATDNLENQQIAGHGDYAKTMIGYSKMLKDKEHARRMEMAEEEHALAISIQKEKLKCAIIEREILEFKKTREEKYTLTNN